jgi:hypothetical protein
MIGQTDVRRTTRREGEGRHERIEGGEKQREEICMDGRTT